MSGCRSFSMVLIAALTVTTLSAARPVAHASTSAADWASTTAQLDKAVLDEDAAALRMARVACLRFVASPAADVPATLARYAVAYADWRMAFNPNVGGAEQSGMLDEAGTQLGQAIKADPKFAEAMGLLSAVDGGKISKNPDLGMSLGMESSMVVQQAQGLEPNNPRLELLLAEDTYHTPPEYGGSIKTAEGQFRHALELYDREPATKPWPAWGRFDAHAWLGQALADRKDLAGARAEYDKALQLAPNSQWVKFNLIPQLGKGGQFQ